jgi:hypothetical protein
VNFSEAPEFQKNNQRLTALLREKSSAAINQAPRFEGDENVVGAGSDYDRFLGTFFPFFRAFESPIAIACFRLLTFPPLPPRPLFAVPRLYRCISLLTSRPAPREYLRFLFAIAFSPVSSTTRNGNHLQPRSV